MLKRPDAFPRRAAAQDALKIGHITGQNHHAPSANARARDGGIEAVGLGDSPRSHKATLAPASDAQTLGVREPSCNGGIDRRHDVAIIGPAHITARSCCELLAM